MRRIFNPIFGWLLLLAVIAVAVWLTVRELNKDDDVRTTVTTISPARVKAIAQMAELCSLDIYEEVGVRDTINGKGIFAIQRLRGAVTFDLSDVRVDSIVPDSLLVYLPREKVEFRESTEPDSYRVVDVWNIKYPLLRANISAAEENRIKQKALTQARQRAYKKGYVRRARTSALESLRKLYSLLPDVHIAVTDTLR